MKQRSEQQHPTAVGDETPARAGVARRQGSISRRKLLLGGGVLGATALAGAGAGGWSIGRRGAAPAPRTGVSETAPTEIRAPFVTRPDLFPPHLQVADVGAEASPGYLMITPSLVPGIRPAGGAQALSRGNGQSGLMIAASHGRLVWFSPGEGLVTNLQVQRYRDEPVLTYWTGRIDGGIGYGTGYLLDRTYRTVATVKAGNGLQTDLHELTLTPQGTALITAYRLRDADLSPIGGRRRGTVYESVVQEIDVATGRLLLEWNSLDHVGIDESYLEAAPEPMDYFHVNSVALWDEDSLLVSGRNTWAVYRVERRSGAVIWRLGGKRSDFTIGTGANFEWQHHVRRAGPRAMTVFDDAATPKEEPESRALVLQVNEPGRRVALTKAYTHPARLLASYEGSVQILPDGNVVVGWGTEPYASEFDPKGNLLLDVRLPTNDQSYRAFRYDWHAVPEAPPDLVVTKDAVGGYAAYVSWNGATEVRHWQLVSGSSPRSLSPVAYVPSASFETAVTVHPPGSYIAAVALDGSGSRLGVSKTARI